MSWESLFGRFFSYMAIAPVLGAFCLILFLYVMNRNYRRMRQVNVPIDYLQNENHLAQVEVENWAFKTKNVLTSRRIVQFRLTWFLSKRKLKSIALKDVHSVIWRRYTNWFFLLAGLWFIGTLNPVALLLILLGLQGKIYTIRFDTPFAQMPWTRIAVLTSWRKQLAEFLKFYRASQSVWAQIRTEENLPVLVFQGNADTESENDFYWSRPVWTYLWIFLVCALLQRMFSNHVKVEDYLLTAVYLGLPVAAARRSLEDGIWTAILGFIFILTIKFPSGGLISFLTSDGAPQFKEYLSMLLVFIVTAWFASLISRYFHPLLSFLALLPWLLFLILHMPSAFYDISFYAKLSLAMAASLMFAKLDEFLVARDSHLEAEG